MYPIKVFDSDFTFLGEIDDYEYLQWNRRYRKFDSVNLEINRYKKHADKLQKGNIIVIERNEKFRAAIIRQRELGLDDTGKISETWKIVAQCAGKYLSSRLALHLTNTGTGYDTQNDIAETVMKHYVDVNMINDTDTNRNIPNLIIAADQMRGANIKYNARFQHLDILMEELSLISGLGWEVYADIEQKKFIFDVIEGKDRTAGQTVNAPVIFSPEFDNVKMLEYFESDLNVKNVAYVAGQGEAQDRAVAEVSEGSFSGYARHETFVDARDLEDNLEQRGLERLSETKEEVALEFQILPYSNFKYLVDYDLGDIVTVVCPGIAEMNSRIIEISEEYTVDGELLSLVTGAEIPDLIKLIKLDRKNTLTEVYR